MKLQNNFTKMDGILQEHSNLWDNKIFPHLPQNTDELAAQTDTLQRKRGIRSAWDLLKIFFIYACSDCSFRILACAAVLTVLSVSWRVPHMHLGSPVFLILHGESAFPNQYRFCMRFSI